MDTIIALLGIISLFCFLGSLILLVLFSFLKKPKKRILLGMGMSLVIFIGAVTIDSDSTQGEETSEVLKVEVSEETPKKSDEEIHQDLIEAAVQADFVEINSGNWEDKVVYIEGRVTAVYDDGIYTTFMLSQKESEDGYGVYGIKILSICIKEKIVDDDIIRVYGRVDGRDSTGLPQISSTYLTKTQQ